MSQLTRCLVVPRAIKAISSSSSGYATKVLSAGILDVKLSQLHQKLHTSEEIAPQLRGLRLHDHHSYRPAAIQFPIPETPISENLKSREQRNSGANDLKYREVYGRVRSVYNQGLKSPPPSRRHLLTYLRPIRLLPQPPAKILIVRFLKNAIRYRSSSERMLSKADLDGIPPELTTTSTRKALHNAASDGALGGEENVPQELKEARVKYGELIGGEEELKAVRKAAFGVEEEVVPIQRGVNIAV